MQTAVTLSVVIPLAPGEAAWHALVADLAASRSFLPATEIILVTTTADAEVVTTKLNASLIAPDFPFETRVVVATQPGRGTQLNLGGEAARGSHLWFLHADTRLTTEACKALSAAACNDDAGLRFLRLAFFDGPRCMCINQWGVRLRSGLLRLPFGDQGFMLRRDLWHALGRFRNDAPYGEDHLFVWQCHRRGVSVRELSATIRTSARKYRARGWLMTTVATNRLTWRQALPELGHLLRGRRPRPGAST